jgi:hypothetical protein
MCALRRQGIPDSFNPDQFGMEQQKRAGATATLERPTERKSDLGKDYRVLLFNDESNTREFVTEVLMKYIPVRTPLILPLPNRRPILPTDAPSCQLFTQPTPFSSNYPRN